jgi:hypothetical protein
MKTLLYIILTYTISITKLFGQSDAVKYQFAKEVFEKEYQTKSYEKFTGKIVIENKNSIKYDEKVLTVPDISDDYKLIFTKGIFYPNIITGNQIAITKRKSEIDSMTANEKLFYSMTRTDSLGIGNFGELEELNPNPQTKRFIFWLWTLGRANPTECYFELKDEKATKETSLKEFIENSKLTFYYKGTIII